MATEAHSCSPSVTSRLEMESCNSSEELFSDVDSGTDDHPLTYKQYRALIQKGAKPPPGWVHTAY